jgi:hypothetical protein
MYRTDTPRLAASFRLTLTWFGLPDKAEAPMCLVKGAEPGQRPVQCRDMPNFRSLTHSPVRSVAVAFFVLRVGTPLPAMRRADEEREPVLIAGDAERPLPDARREVAGSTEG